MNVDGTVNGKSNKVPAAGQKSPKRFLPDVIKATPSEIIDQQSFADPFGLGKRLRLGSNIPG